MSNIESDPPGFISFDGLCPDGSEGCRFIVAKDGILGHLDWSRNRSKMLEGLLCPQIARKPSGIWRDLKSPGKEDWLAYAGLPDSRPMLDMSIEIPIVPGKVFVFYVMSLRGRSGELRVDSWEWVDASPERADFPIDHDTRYGERSWPPE
jgi:hypothetical protein